MEKIPSILLIDDDATNNFLNERLLQRLNVAERLLVAESGQEALDLLQEAAVDTPALILLDVKMPGMTGIEFLEKYQQARQRQARPTVVVMLTTTMDSQDLLRMNELHIDGLVSKPLTEEKIDNLLQLHFQRRLAA